MLNFRAESRYPATQTESPLSRSVTVLKSQFHPNREGVFLTAIIEVRTRFNEIAKCKIASVSGALDRAGTMREIASENGLELTAGFYSISNNEGLAHLSGNPSKSLLPQTILNGSGAYHNARSGILDRWLRNKPALRNSETNSSKFEAPNRDEIDRMLLEE